MLIKNLLKNIAKDLKQRADHDVKYFYSTNHVKPMTVMSSFIYEELGKDMTDAEYKKLLKTTAEIIEVWHREIYSGSWSTQNADYFKKTINDIYLALN